MRALERRAGGAGIGRDGSGGWGDQGDSGGPVGPAGSRRSGQWGESGRCDRVRQWSASGSVERYGLPGCYALVGRYDSVERHVRVHGRVGFDSRWRGVRHDHVLSRSGALPADAHAAPGSGPPGRGVWVYEPGVPDPWHACPCARPTVVNRPHTRTSWGSESGAQVGSRAPPHSGGLSVARVAGPVRTTADRPPPVPGVGEGRHLASRPVHPCGAAVPPPCAGWSVTMFTCVCR